MFFEFLLQRKILFVSVARLFMYYAQILSFSKNLPKTVAVTNFETFVNVRDSVLVKSFKQCLYATLIEYAKACVIRIGSL